MGPRAGYGLAACTIAAKRHLSLGRVVAGSFRENHPDVPFFLLLADEPGGTFAASDEPFELLELSDKIVPHRRELCFRYTQQELTYALTPFVIRALLAQGFNQVIFIKQESLVTGDLLAVVEPLRDHSAVLTPHLLEPLRSGDAVDRELNILISGSYNGGFAAFSDSPEALAFLAWWEDRLLTHCVHAVADGIHFEQRWLDLAPAYMDRVWICRDPGMNVAHWNLPERRVEWDGKAATVDGQPCRLFRFSGYDPHAPNAVTRYYDRLNLDNAGPAAAVYRHYRERLMRAGYESTAGLPYAWEHFSNGVPVPAIARRVYADGQFDSLGNPFEVRPGSYFEWLNDSSAGVSNLWREVYNRRPDLQAAFQDINGRERKRFARWADRFGRTELGIAEAFKVCQ